MHPTTTAPIRIRILHSFSFDHCIQLRLHCERVSVPAQNHSKCLMCARGRQNIQIKGQSKRAKANSAKQCFIRILHFGAALHALSYSSRSALAISDFGFLLGNCTEQQTSTSAETDRDSTEYITQTLTHTLTHFQFSFFRQRQNAVFTGKGSKPFSYSRRSAKKSKIK